MANVSALDQQPGLRDFIAGYWHMGKSNQEIADLVAQEFPMLEPVARTIIRWRKDDEIARKVATLQRDRVTRILRKTDNEIMARLDNAAAELDIDELIKIRKALLPNVDAFTDEKQDKKGVLKALFDAADEDPEVGRRIAKAFEQANG